MSTIARIAGFAVVMLSLSYLVSAMPTPDLKVDIPALIGTDAVSCVLAKWIVEIVAKINALVGCGTIAEITIGVEALVALLQGCSDDLLKIGAGAVVSFDVQLNIAACLAAVITLLVKVCVAVTLKFGLAVVLALYAKIDVCLQLLLVNLNICIGGILVLIAKAFASATVGLLAEAQFNLCLHVLGLAGL